LNFSAYFQHGHHLPSIEKLRQFAGLSSALNIFDFIPVADRRMFWTFFFDTMKNFNLLVNFLFLALTAWK